MRSVLACILAVSLVACATVDPGLDPGDRPVVCHETDGAPDDPIQCVERYEGALRLCRYHRQKSQQRAEQTAQTLERQEWATWLLSAGAFVAGGAAGVGLAKLLP
jgi:hypothetical protein